VGCACQTKSQDFPVLLPESVEIKEELLDRRPLNPHPKFLSMFFLIRVSMVLCLSHIGMFVQPSEKKPGMRQATSSVGIRGNTSAKMRAIPGFHRC
jgi:hypothetical protein